MKKILTASLVIICMFMFGISAYAQTAVDIFNRGEKVSLPHELVYYEDCYFINIEDLTELGLTVDKTDETGLKTYTITSYDCLGQEKKLTLETTYAISDSEDFVISDIENDEILSAQSIEDNCLTNINLWKRSEKQIGETHMFSPDILINDIFVCPNSNTVINIDGDYYVCMDVIGKNLSYDYSILQDRINLHISDKESVVLKTTVNLQDRVKAPSGGFKVDIYAAEKTGDGNSLSDFEILAKTSTTIPANESGTECFIEIPAEKITDSNFYYIADFGERYALASEEYDFSKVGHIKVYAQQKDVKYTAKINLPAADENDVTFTVYMRTDNGVYSKSGVIKSGELSTVFQMPGLPLSSTYKSKIIFDNHKYKNAFADGKGTADYVYYYNTIFAKDFEEEFTIGLSGEVLCKVNLPDDFVCDGDINVNLQLVSTGNDIIADDGLDNYSHPVTVTLNNENRSAVVPVYGILDKTQLLYTLNPSVDGLCKSGFLKSDGTTTSDSKLAMTIEDSQSAEITLLKRKNITVNINRPSDIPQDNAIYARVELHQKNKLSYNIETIDFTEAPLINAGEMSGSFSIDLTEDEEYTMKITNITGDEHIFQYCYYVEPFTSGADLNNARTISYSDDSIDVNLIGCNKISGTVESGLEKHRYTVTADCTLNTGEVVEVRQNTGSPSFSINIPADTVSYTLSVQTKIEIKSYYVSDGVSTNYEYDAAKITDICNKTDIVLKYIEQYPVLPFKVSFDDRINRFEVKKVSDYDIEKYDLYISYYDKNGTLISSDKDTKNYYVSQHKYDLENAEIKKVKAFVWQPDGMKPFGNTVELSVNE